ncbi:hypothetical protein [Microbacterium sp.]|uniref:hypothetical protein n=1 Tax=Microbacterium sp. TaxID=51671 RepID=UPI0039E23888
MRWDRFFEDLEDQLDSEWEAERAALDTEAERLRQSRIPLHDRLVAVAEAAGEHEASFELADGTVLAGILSRVGPDWLAVACPGEAARRAKTMWIVPLTAVAAATLAAPDMLASVRDAAAGSPLGQRMSLGFVLRDLVRRRVPVTVRLTSGRILGGTLDRAGADHFDLALHEAGVPRRAGSVSGYRVVPFAALAAVRIDAPTELP